MDEDEYGFMPKYTVQFSKFKKEGFSKEIIESGSNSYIYLLKLQDGRNFVMKEFNDTSRALKEAKYLKMLESKYVVEMKSAYVFDSKYFILLEYAEKKTLKDAIQNNELSNEDKEKILVRLIEALQFFQMKNFIHRNLRPDNILLFKKDNEYIPKICALGSGEHVENVDKETTFKADMFSFGCIVYELFTGNPLYKNTYAQIFTDENSLKSKVKEFLDANYPAAAKNVISKTLFIKASRRKNAYYLYEFCNQKGGGKGKTRFCMNLITRQLYVFKESLTIKGYAFNEKQITEACKFKSVVNLIDSFNQDEELVLDFIPGVELNKVSKVLRKKGAECFKILYGVIRGIKEVVDLGYCHRDLAPSNIIVDYNYEPHIIDFGEATHQSGEGKVREKDEQLKGQYLIIPPEGRRGNNEFQIKYYDVYSYSVSMACSFFGDNCLSVPRKDQIIELCGKELGELFIQGMNDDPTKRPDPDEMCNTIYKIACNNLNVDQLEDFFEYSESFDDSIKKDVEFNNKRIRKKKEVTKEDLREMKEYQTKKVLMGWENNLEKLEKMKKQLEEIK